MSSDIHTDGTAEAAEVEAVDAVDATDVDATEAEQQQPEIPFSSTQDIISLILAALMIIGMVFCFIFLM